MERRGGESVSRFKNLDDAIRPKAAWVDGELGFSISRPGVGLRNIEGRESIVADNIEEAATEITEFIPSSAAAAD